MEEAPKENFELVNRIWKQVFEADKAKLPVGEDLRLIYEVEDLSMEANSGASFEQYFRWAAVEEIDRIVSLLQKLELFEAAKITSEAIDVAFPSGIPRTWNEKDDLTSWSEDQGIKLRELFTQFENYNGRIANRLADHARTVGLDVAI